MSHFWYHLIKVGEVNFITAWCEWEAKSPWPPQYCWYKVHARFSLLKMKFSDFSNDTAATGKTWVVFMGVWDSWKELKCSLPVWLYLEVIVFLCSIWVGQCNIWLNQWNCYLKLPCRFRFLLSGSFGQKKSVFKSRPCFIYGCCHSVLLAASVSHLGHETKWKLRQVKIM